MTTRPARSRKANGYWQNGRCVVLLAAFIAVFVISLAAEGQKPPSWKDDLADRLVGKWNAEGTVMNRPAHHQITARWVLNHQFVELNEETNSDAPSSESRYDAIWYLGHDDVTQHYVLHLLDLFGGRFSETLGDGLRNENDIRFAFEYPDGSFRTIWSWQVTTKCWKWHMEQKDKTGKWTTFADLFLKPIP